MESPKSALRQIRQRRPKLPPSKENPKSVFLRLAERHRRLLRQQQENEVLALCARAELEPDAQHCLAIYEGARRYDRGGMTQGVRQIVLRVLDRIVATEQRRQAVEDGPKPVLPS
jgi:hypothetical protein